jgi:type IV secretion system protein VirB4
VAAAAHLERDLVFGALTRPQMFAGVTYSYFVLNAVITVELFLITKSFGRCWRARDPRGGLFRLPEGAALLRPVAGAREPLPARQEHRLLALQLLRALAAWPDLLARPASRPDPRREQPAGARLPYARHVDDVTVETRDGRLMQVLHLRGFAFETADTDELNYRKTVRETMLRGVANSRFALYHHIVRREVEPELAGEFPDPFSANLNASWRARLDTRRLYVNELFLTLMRRPLQGRVGLLQETFRSLRGASDRQESEAAFARDLSALNAARDGLLSALDPYGVRLLSAYEGPQGLCSEPLEFLSMLYNGEMRPVRIPNADLGAYLPYRRVSFGADALELGAAGRLPREFAAMVSVKDYPGSSAPGMLDDLLRLPFEMVLTESFGFVDRQQTLDRMNLALRRMRAADDEAISLRRDLVTAKDDVAAGAPRLASTT